MPAITRCPDRDLLRRLVLGRVDGPEAERLAHHLEECDRCASVAQTLPAEDTLVEAARAPATDPDRGQQERLRVLVDRLRDLGPPVEEPDATESLRGQASAGVHVAEESYAFL